MSNEKSFYRNGLIYDAMNDSLVSDTHFYLKEFENEKGSILELACGTGRITCALAQVGKQISGLDLSKTMLDVAMVKSKKMNLNINWHLGSMVDFNLDNQFDIIFVGYNSVHHILTNQDFKSFLASVKKHLKPSGRFLFDIFNPSLALLNQQKVRSLMDDFIDPETGEKVTVTEDNYYDAATQINHVTYYYSKKDQLDYHSHPLNMRCYFPQEMDALLECNGFKIIHKYGSFDKTAFQSKSMKQIFDCRFE
jgi:ubiquinone/menaquinone biosynthesis C-methylase UbiE